MNGVVRKFDELDLRRKELGISYSVLAELSGVSKPAIQRMLSGKVDSPALSSVAAVARALGMGGIRFKKNGAIKFDSIADAQTLRERQARRRALRLVGPIQETSAIPGTAAGETAYQIMVERKYHELLAGSRRGLWGWVVAAPPV